MQCRYSVKRQIFAAIFFIALFIVHSASAQNELQDVKVLKEYTDKKGNTVRKIQYTKQGKRLTETVYITAFINVPHFPINTDTLIKDSLLIVVNKSKYALQLYYRKKLIRAYKAVFGPKPLDEKCYEGDRCTPEGWYKISGKNNHNKYNKFLLLNYPDTTAQRKFAAQKNAGKIPATARIGGGIGIHGIWKGGDDLIESRIGWTDGCVALKNEDIDDLFKLVFVGTRVYIHK
jgi:murein L,D-transpeptidase YafK